MLRSNTHGKTRVPRWQDRDPPHYEASNIGRLPAAVAEHQQDPHIEARWRRRNVRSEAGRHCRTRPDSMHGAQQLPGNSQLEDKSMNGSLLGLGATALLAAVFCGSTVNAAEGDQCTAQTDCGAGYECDLSPSAYSEPGSQDVAGTEGSGGAAADVAVPVSQGTCERAAELCQVDADCGEHYICSMGDSASAAVGCDPAGDCSSVPPEPVAAETGECTGKIISCVQNSQCPTASLCLEGVCAFDLRSCTQNSECVSGYECFVETTETCSTAPCAVGMDCNPEPICDTAARSEGYCLPKAVACTADVGCEGDLLCYDIPNKDAPGDYATTDFACWPAGLIGVLEGYVAPAMNGTVLESESDSMASMANGTSDEGAVRVGTAPVSSADDGGGCSLTGTGARTETRSGLFAALALLAIGLRRRRPKSAETAPTAH